MAADRRYPWMERVRDGVSGVDPRDRVALGRAAREIERRTGVTCWLNHRFGSMQFSDGDDPSFCYDVMDSQVLIGGGRGRVPRVDLVVGEIGAARSMTPEQKKRAAEEASAADEHAMEAEAARFAADYLPEYLAQARFERNKIEHGRHSRPSVLVGA